MIYELRIYEVVPGRLEDVRQRFQKFTFRLLEKHGVTVCAFWEDKDGKDQIYYLCSYKDQESRERAWSDFQKDPEWIEAKAKSVQHGEIVSRITNYFLQETSYFQNKI